MLQTKISPQLCSNTFALCVRFAYTLAQSALGKLLAIFLRSCRRKLLPSLSLPLKAVDMLEQALETEQLLKTGSLYMVKDRIKPRFRANFWHYHLSAYVKQPLQPVQPVPWGIPLHREASKPLVHFHISQIMLWLISQVTAKAMVVFNSAPLLG